MKYWLFNITVVLSLLLILATVAMWVDLRNLDHRFLGEDRRVFYSNEHLVIYLEGSLWQVLLGKFKKRNPHSPTVYADVSSTVTWSALS